MKGLLIGSLVVLAVPFLQGCERRNPPANRVMIVRFGMRGDSTGHSDFLARTSRPGLMDSVQQELAKPPSERGLHFNGRIERARPGENLQWHWASVENQWQLAQMSVEVCDGQPAYVDEHLEEWLRQVGHFCPWHSYVKSASTDSTGAL